MFHHLLKQQVAEMILKTAALKSQQSNTSHFILATQTNHCRHADFRYLSYLTDISITTLKRLFNPNNQQVKFCNTKNQQKIAHFLGYTNWFEVEKVILKKLVEEHG